MTAGSDPLASEAAPAKINLCLFLGSARADGRHELVTLFDSVSLRDELTVWPAARDEVVCDGVAGPNLVGSALAALREAGWDAPPVSVQIVKRIPVAAGMGGGSADAAAMLRLAPRLGSVPASAVESIARGLGADVPAQLRPGPSLGTGAGEIVRPLGGLPDYGVLVIPQPFELSTADVYREADRLGLARSAGELSALRARLEAALPAGPEAALPAGPEAALPAGLPAELVVNDLQAAAVSLAPSVDDALRAAGETGADHVLVCGSGPTVIGVFWGGDGPARAAAAADLVRPRFRHALAAAPEVSGTGRRNLFP